MVKMNQKVERAEIEIEAEYDEGERTYVASGSVTVKDEQNETERAFATMGAGATVQRSIEAFARDFGEQLIEAEEVEER